MSKKKELFKLYRECFDDSFEYVKNFFSQYYTKKRTRCIISGGNIVSALYLLPKHLVFSGKIWKIFFFVAGCTKLEYRNKGYYKQLVKETIEDCAKSNAPFVLLYPTKHELYEKLGFASVSFVSSFVANYDGNDAEFKEISHKDVVELFNNFTSKFGIAQYRTDKEIKKIVKRWAAEDIHPVLFERNGQKCYVACSKNQIEEAVGELSVLNGVKEFDTKIFIDFTKKIEPYCMARVASPVALLKSIDYAKPKGTYNFKIVDNLSQANNMIVSLFFESGKPQVQNTTKYDFIVDCRDLIKLAFGMQVPNCPINDIIKKKEVVIVDRY